MAELAAPSLDFLAASDEFWWLGSAKFFNVELTVLQDLDFLARHAVSPVIASRSWRLVAAAQWGRLIPG
jgi:hypothetical protein